MGQLSEFSGTDLPAIDPNRLAHRGDPCIYCSTPRNEQLAVGSCPWLVEYFAKIKQAEEQATAALIF